MISLTKTLRSLKAPIPQGSEESVRLTSRIAQVLQLEEDNSYTRDVLIGEALEGDLHAGMGLLAAVFPKWEIGDGVNQPPDRFVAQLYSPNGAVVEGEGATFVLAVVDAMVSAKTFHSSDAKTSLPGSGPVR